MTMQYTYVSPHLPENKMRLYPTKVINIIGGPGCEKSLFTSAIILYLHLHHKTVEQIPDYAKSLVWQKDYEALRNQYKIAQQQFHMLELLDGQVQFLVTEASLPQVLYYNEFYPDNICDTGKTRKQILDWYKQHTNINVMVERGVRKYNHTGRFQDEEQAKEVDRGMRALLRRESIPYTALKPDLEAINAFMAEQIKA
ncbi:MAG: hypothetical protein Q8R72_16445 [Hylemonella sp.]|nr:hypothetical protein [Hylemonella sp.]